MFPGTKEYALELGDRIRRWRKDGGYSIASLARILIDLHGEEPMPNYDRLRGIEVGRLRCYHHEVEAIAQVLRASASEFNIILKPEDSRFAVFEQTPHVFERITALVKNYGTDALKALEISVGQIEGIYEQISGSARTGSDTKKGPDEPQNSPK